MTESLRATLRMLAEAPTSVAEIEGDTDIATTEPETNRRSRSEHARRINMAWRRSKESLFETGDCLEDAKRELDRDEYKAMLADDLAMDAATARKLRLIAKNRTLRSHVNAVPGAFTALYELSQIPSERLEILIADGVIHAKLKRHEAEQLAATELGEPPHRPTPRVAEPEPEPEDEQDASVDATIAMPTILLTMPTVCPLWAKVRTLGGPAHLRGAARIALSSRGRGVCMVPRALSKFAPVRRAVRSDFAQVVAAARCWGSRPSPFGVGTLPVPSLDDVPLLVGEGVASARQRGGWCELPPDPLVR
jgi:hypothetical protein